MPVIGHFAQNNNRLYKNTLISWPLSTNAESELPGNWVVQFGEHTSPVSMTHGGIIRVRGPYTINNFVEGYEYYTLQGGNQTKTLPTWDLSQMRVEVKEPVPEETVAYIKDNAKKSIMEDFGAAMGRTATAAAVGRWLGIPSMAVAAGANAVMEIPGLLFSLARHLPSALGLTIDSGDTPENPVKICTVDDSNFIVFIKSAPSGPQKEYEKDRRALQQLKEELCPALITTHPPDWLVTMYEEFVEVLATKSNEDYSTLKAQTDSEVIQIGIHPTEGIIEEPVLQNDIRKELCRSTQREIEHLDDEFSRGKYYTDISEWDNLFRKYFFFQNQNLAQVTKNIELDGGIAPLYTDPETNDEISLTQALFDLARAKEENYKIFGG